MQTRVKIRPKAVRERKTLCATSWGGDQRRGGQGRVGGARLGGDLRDIGDRPLLSARATNRLLFPLSGQRGLCKNDGESHVQSMASTLRVLPSTPENGSPTVSRPTILNRGPPGRCSDPARVVRRVRGEPHMALRWGSNLFPLTTRRVDPSPPRPWVRIFPFPSGH